jgi:hypothetical protein
MIGIKELIINLINISRFSLKYLFKKQSSENYNN